MNRLSEPPQHPARPRVATGPTARRRLVADRLAAWLVSAGGLLIILSILGILVFILLEVGPLTRAARVTAERSSAVTGDFGALIVDEHRTLAAGLSADGHLRVVRLQDGRLVEERELLPGSRFTGMALAPGGRQMAAATEDGRLVIAPVEFAVSFEGDRRQVAAQVGTPAVLPLDPQGGRLGAFAVQEDEAGNATGVAQLADRSLAVVQRSVETNLLSGETAESFSRFTAPVPVPLSALTLSSDRRQLFAGTPAGEIFWWSLQDGQLSAPRRVSAGASPVTALTLLIGGRSLVVGQENGAISVWLPLQKDDRERLVRIREFPRLAGGVALLAPSTRNKGFVAVGKQGRLGLYYSTSHRTLWTGASSIASPSAVFFTPKADGIFLAGGGELAGFAVDNPHPEITWRTLFGKVWYEGYDRPELVWQSSGGTDDFEPKISLTPLLAGTLKGTFYSLLLAIPLGVFGAMYTSQFMHPAYKRVVKPLIEIMASLPSVVLGFLAGLWLAPRLEKGIPGLILAVVLLPVSILLAGFLWKLLPRAVRGRFPLGSEVFLFVVVIAGALGASISLAPHFESFAFAGSFQAWLQAATGLSYDQRNAVVVGLAMGFAVIPIIFAIAEDAFSNVPPNLVAGSLALGADLWQTVTRVVLPTASPGIFSAVMIGFGRAIGETMIVLMATGNTPILDWNPFNGFRTLSANIAVEIPEAPHGSTLYRTLFLAALLLFVMTFLINTVAELVRQRLRERYSQL